MKPSLIRTGQSKASPYLSLKALRGLGGLIAIVHDELSRTDPNADSDSWAALGWLRRLESWHLMRWTPERLARVAKAMHED